MINNTDAIQTRQKNLYNIYIDRFWVIKLKTV